MKITIIAGARPNFMKIAPIIHAIQDVQKAGKNLKYRLVHTGQHYDQRMSNTFFRELNIPEPDANLGCGGGTQAEQTAAIMVAFEKELLAIPTDLVLVVGDVTSTMACSIVAKKLYTKVAHVEAGIRSWDLSMPEEINRMVTDALTDYFFTTTEMANDNLRKTGIKDEQIFFVGNVMIDSLLSNRSRFKKPPIWDAAGLEKGNYIVMTLHRPANVDEENKFREMLDAIIKASRGLPVIFPVHPRTAKMINQLFAKRSLRFSDTQHSGAGELNVDGRTNPDVIGGIGTPKQTLPETLKLIEPLGYLEFNYLIENAKAVLTDSGGITEETTVMGVPCMTLRDNTERPETITIGTNELLGTDPANLKPAFDKLFLGNWKQGDIPEFWDGKSAKRIVEHLLYIEAN